MSLMLLRRVGAVLSMIVLGLMLLAPTASAAPLGGEGGGGEPGPSPVTLTLDAFTLLRDGSVLFTGTVTCDLAADVFITFSAQQGTIHHYVSVPGSAKLGCEAGTSNPLEVLFAPERGRFHPGTLTIGIELDACTRPDDSGNGVCINQFGIPEWQLGPPVGR